MRVNTFPGISLPRVCAHTFPPPPSDVSCSAFSSHIPTSPWMQLQAQSSAPLGLVPSLVPLLGGCLGTQPVLCLVGRDLASPSPGTARASSGSFEFPVALLSLQRANGTTPGRCQCKPFHGTALVKPSEVFWGQVAEVLLLREAVHVPADRSVISRALCLEFPL